jgi:hypothetical protein
MSTLGYVYKGCINSLVKIVVDIEALLSGGDSLPFDGVDGSYLGASTLRIIIRINISKLR